MNMRPLHHALAAGLAVLLAGPAMAAIHCVDTPAALDAAIDAAETNGENDVILLVSGTYVASDAFHFVSGEPHSIAFIGGWSANCTNTTGELSTLDGEQQRQGLRVVNYNGDIAIEGLTFARGQVTTGTRGGGLYTTSESGDIRIDRNIFVGNRADTYDGAAYAATETGTMRVRGNLTYGNSGAIIGAFELVQVTGTAYVVGNTFAYNTSDSEFSPGGLRVAGNAHFVVSNNIIWGNLPDNPSSRDSDFEGSDSHDRYANDIGVVSITSGTGEVVGELNVDPQFAECGFLCFGFELERGSPLVDAGIDEPVGGMTATDLARKPRTIGPHVDIGAYENDLLFADGFD